MIAIVTGDKNAFSNVTISDMTLSWDESQSILVSAPNIVGFDSEGEGRVFMKDELHIIQLAWDDKVIIIDCTTIDYSMLKEWMSSRTIVVHHALNDLPFLYKRGVYPKNVYCTYLAEKVLSMGRDCKMGIEDLCEKYKCGVIDKTFKGKILYEINDDSIGYCVNDVKYLLSIRRFQMQEAEKLSVRNAIVLECKFVAVLAYMSYCGVHLDEQRWNDVISYNAENVSKALSELDEFVFSNFTRDNKLCIIDMQGDLFDGFKQTRTCLVKWNNEASVSNLYAKCTPEQTSVLDGLLAEYRKMISASKTHGKAYLGFISSDGRIHPKYNQLGITGRVSCPKTGFSSKGFEMPMPSFMDLPKEGPYRKSVIAQQGNVLVSADWSAFEVCIAACLSKDEALIALCSTPCIHDNVFRRAMCKYEGKPVYELAKKKAKTLNIAFINGITTYGLCGMVGCQKNDADVILTAYQKAYPKLVEYQIACSSMADSDRIVFNENLGYSYAAIDVERMRNASAFTDKKGMKLYYDSKNRCPSDPFVKQMDWYFSERRRLAKLSISGHWQYTGAVIFKYACSMLYRKIIDNGWFGVVKIIIPQHDSITLECPEGIKDEVLDLLTSCMNVSCEKMLGGFVIQLKTYISNEYK